MNDDLKKEAREHWLMPVLREVDSGVVRHNVEEIVNRLIDRAYQAGVEAERARLREAIPPEKYIGEKTHCESCDGHRAAGECDCVGYNAAIKEVVTAIEKEL